MNLFVGRERLYILQIEDRGHEFCIFPPLPSPCGVSGCFKALYRYLREGREGRGVVSLLVARENSMIYESWIVVKSLSIFPSLT